MLEWILNLMDWYVETDFEIDELGFKKVREVFLL